MRILVCAAEAPIPPVNGFRLQLIHLCGELARNHEVCVLAYRAPDQQGEAPPGVELIDLPPPASGRGRLAATARALFAGRPRRVEVLAPAMSASIRELIARRDFDIAHVGGSALAPVTRALGGTPAVLAALDAWHLNIDASINVAAAPRRALLRLERRRVQRFGRHAYRDFRSVVVVSEQDAEAMRALDPSLRVEVVPNGADSDYYAPEPEVAREPGLVVFTGSMAWAPNAEAAGFLAERVLPRLRASVPEARLAIVGRDPGPSVRDLARGEGVEVTGEVPDVRPWLHRASAFACPMVSGTGIKNKLLEALSCGTPAVATSLSCQGIRATVGEDLLVADAPGEFADALGRILRDPSLGAHLGRQARGAIVKEHSWERVAQEYERVYATAP